MIVAASSEFLTAASLLPRIAGLSVRSKGEMPFDLRTKKAKKNL
jgi:hypothetical protein